MIRCVETISCSTNRMTCASLWTSGNVSGCLTSRHIRLRIDITVASCRSRASALLLLWFPILQVGAKGQSRDMFYEEAILGADVRPCPRRCTLCKPLICYSLRRLGSLRLVSAFPPTLPTFTSPRSFGNAIGTGIPLNLNNLEAV